MDGKFSQFIGGMCINGEYFSEIFNFMRKVVLINDNLHAQCQQCQHVIDDNFFITLQ